MQFLHFGMRVNDIRRSSELLHDLVGISWEPVKEYVTTSGAGDSTEEARSLVTHGLTADGVEIEMVQSLEGPSPDTFVLGDREGLSHIAYRVDDLESALATARDRGLRVVNSYQSDYVDFVFCDGPGLGGMLLQLVRFHRDREPIATAP